jgi:uncharacterized protein YcbX
MPDIQAKITTLYRHPVKGLSPEPITEAELVTDGHFPFDRLYALENGPSGWDAAAPEHMPKMKFLMLMRHERLARLQTRYTPETRVLEIRQGGQVAASGALDSEAGRGAIERFFESYMGDALRGPVKLLAAPRGFRFMDSRSGYISILNRATIDAIAATFGRETLDARRFRGNVLVEGMEAFAENDLVGQKLTLGEAELEVIKRIERCAATDVDPSVGIRDLGMVGGLERAFGHHDCGIYARITRGGTIRLGDRLSA